MWVLRLFDCRRPSTNSKKRRRNYFKTTCHTIALFLLGIAVCFLITEVGKRKSLKKIRSNSFVKTFSNLI